MKKKLSKTTIAIIIIVITFICLIAGAIVFTINFKEDQEKMTGIIKTVKTDYNEFNTLVNEFSVKRAEFYTIKNDYFYLESVNENYESINTIKNEYKELIIKIEDQSSNLKEYCELSFADYSAYNRCNLFKQGYEAVTNYYINDMNLYNNFSEQYNLYIDENNLELTKLELADFPYHKEYIDYDNDDYYLGGE